MKTIKYILKPNFKNIAAIFNCRLSMFNYIFLSGILLLACNQDFEDNYIPSPSATEKSVEITMRLNTPGGFPSRTRMLIETQESEIHNAYIFGFKTGVLSYVKSVEEMSDTDNGKSFKVTLKASQDASDTYKLMVLANAEEWILPLTGSDLKGLNGKTYNEVQQALKETGVNEAMFPSGGSVVMWGELPYEEIRSTGKTFSVSLVRSIARIDVGVGATGFDPVSKLADWGGLTDFVLEGIYLYKPNNAYYFVPRSGNFDETDKITLQPSPAGAQLASPLVYSVADGISLVRNIYTTEADIRIGTAATSGDKNHTNRAAIVVKGSYKGNAPSYYRLDFINSSRELINILRNHLYQFNIKSVSGNGFDTPDEAYASMSVNMDVEVIDWNDGDIDDIVFDGQYMLGVSRGQVTLSREQKNTQDTDNQLFITTDVPDGWAIEGITDADGNTATVSWLKVSRSSGPANAKTTVSILTEENGGSGNRTGYIHIIAGRLNYKVEVIQTNYARIDLRLMDGNDIEINEMLFQSHISGTVPAQLLSVNWLPQNAGLYVTTTSVTGTFGFDFGAGDVITTGPAIGVNGRKDYTIQPPAMTPDEVESDPFREKMMKVDYAVVTEAGSVTKSILLVQRNYTAVPKPDAGYQMNGSEQFFTINANAPWRIEIGSDPGHALDRLITTSGGEGRDKREEKVYFKPVDDPLASASEVTLIVKSADPEYPFADVPVKISFIPGQASFSVNCENSKVNGVYTSSVPVEETNTITLEVTVDEPGGYHIISDEVDGLSFEGFGEFRTTGVQEITLRASGTPAGTRTKKMTLSTSDGDNICSVSVLMFIPKKTILSLGSDGWAIHSSSGIAKIFKNTENFGPYANSTFKTIVPDVFPSNASFITTLTASALKPYLEPAAGNPVDIVIMTYNADLSGVDAAIMLSNYVKKGGVLVMLNEHNMATAANISFIRMLFGNVSITGTDDAVAAGTVLKLPEYNDRILNGPFGDLRGKYIGEDLGAADVLTSFPANEIEWYISSVDYSGTGGNSNRIFAFKAKNYNFFWCGDGGMASSNNTYTYTNYPATLTSDNKPSNRLYGRNASNRRTVDNASFFANLLAWAMQQAEFEGINAGK